MKNKELKFLLNMALETAEKAARAVMKDLSKARKVRQEMRRDIKINADNELEKLIIESLNRNSNYPILSEESGNIKGEGGSSGYHWIVDPLDGSLNFSRGIPNSCISIALWNKNDPVLGVIFDFNRDEAFTAITGMGAWLNGKLIRVSKVNKMSKAVLCTGFPSDSRFASHELNNFVGDIRRFKKVRLLGSAALSLAYVACGRADFYWENGIKFWDVAAGLCLVKAAGGGIEFKKTEKENALNVKAANAELL